MLNSTRAQLERRITSPLKRGLLYVAVKLTGPSVNLCPFIGGKIQQF